MKNLLIKFILVISMTLFLFNCQNDSNTVSKDTANAYLLAALVKSSELDTYKNSFIEIQGYWQDGYYFGGSYTKNTDPILITTESDTVGSWSAPSSYGNTIRRIIEFDDANNRLYYQESAYDSFSGSKYGRIDWTEITTSGCENSATKCFNYCLAVFGKNSLSEAKSDTTTSDSSDYKNSGCGSAAWSHATYISNTESW